MFWSFRRFPCLKKKKKIYKFSENLKSFSNILEYEGQFWVGNSLMAFSGVKGDYIREKKKHLEFTWWEIITFIPNQKLVYEYSYKYLQRVSSISKKGSKYCVSCHLRYILRDGKDTP